MHVIIILNNLRLVNNDSIIIAAAMIRFDNLLIFMNDGEWLFSLFDIIDEYKREQNNSTTFFPLFVQYLLNYLQIAEFMK